MRTPCTDREFEANRIAVAAINEVGSWRAIAHMVRQVVHAPMPRQSWAALALLRATPRMPERALQSQRYVAAHDAHSWFKVHRWPDALDGNALDHFRCTRCGDRAGWARPTENKPTVTNFFPADERGWKMLVRRLRD